MNSAEKDPDVLTEVPETLKRLIRYVARGFYGKEHAIVIDYLVHHPCVKEDDLIELIRFDRKQFRAVVNQLKNDKFIKVRMRMETDAENKATRHNYYFINYSTFVNVVKYKLDLMRRKIETEERDATSRASFKCPGCQKTYTDLEADRLLELVTQTLRCTYCDAEVEEEYSTVPKQDARTLMVKFNEQIEPIYILLREVEDVKLAPELLEPEPVDIKAKLRPPGSRNKHDMERGKWSGDASRNTDYGYTESQVTVNMDADKMAAAPRVVKEQPVWMTNSTVEGAATESTSAKENPLITASASATASDTAYMAGPPDDVMRTLLAHEKKSSKMDIPAGEDRESSSSDSDDETSRSSKPGMFGATTLPPSAAGGVEEMESDDDDDTVPTMSVGGVQMSYHDITEEIVNRMTPQEKDEYIRVGQEMYQNMYD